MKITITSDRLEPDTVRGEAFQAVYTYSSFDKNEIDEVEQRFKEQSKGAYAIIINTEDDLK